MLLAGLKVHIQTTKGYRLQLPLFHLSKELFGDGSGQTAGGSLLPVHLEYGHVDLKK